MHLRCLTQRSVLAFARVHAHECAEPNDARLLGLGSTRCRSRLVRKLPATACARAAMAAFGLLLCPIGRGAWRSRHPSVAHGAVPGEATTRKWPSEKLRSDLQTRESCKTRARSSAHERFASESSTSYLSVLACVPMLLGRNVLAKRAMLRNSRLMT